MRKLSRSGHAEYSVVLESQLFQSGCPDLKKINFILRKAAKHGSDGARYFMMMLLVLSINGTLVDDAFLIIFKDLFDHQQLANCKGAIMNVEGPPYFLGHFWTRTLLLEFTYQFTCTFNHSYRGHGRRPGVYWPFPGSDDDY